MSFNGTSVGLDVHALSVVAHAFDEETGHVERARLCPDNDEILDWLHKLRGPVRVAYEAGPTGFGLARALAAAEIDCVVAAPSKLIRPSGDRVKTDARDAAHLTRLLRLGEITAVVVPDAELEAVRDLVRAREDARADLMRVRHLKYPGFCSDLYRRIRSMPRQYSPEFRDRALRLLDTMMEASDISEFEAIKSVASKLGISEESVRRWRRKAQVDAGERPGTSSSEHAEIRKLKREVAELRRANELLKSASAFFAAELDRPVTK
ncbi:Transposase [Mycolicibacterium obuense]|uniref:Transposase n=4 Tax=Actinomycetes TaxID=1760 RepID=A0A0J6VP90_9MYCO|nr:Transposase [Mycolicibacterium obuense]